MIPDEAMYVTLVVRRDGAARWADERDPLPDQVVEAYLDPHRAAADYGGNPNYYFQIVRLVDAAQIEDTVEDVTVNLEFNGTREIDQEKIRAVIDQALDNVARACLGGRTMETWLLFDDGVPQAGS